MPDTTARLALPVLLPAQGQKHVTHNEALEMLDGMVQLVLASLGSTSPPAEPVPGALYALGVAASGAWAGQDGRLAQWSETGWMFLDPQDGWRAWELGGDRLVVFRDGDWGPWRPDFDQLEGVGIGATADAVNRLSVAGEATLLSHAGGVHRLKINKAAEAQVAALLYQSEWAGHAELGLVGNNDLHLRVSADGNTWTEALVVAAATGLITGEAVQSGPADVTPGRLAPATFWGWWLRRQGRRSGAVIERGSTAEGEYVRFADGTQICTCVVTLETASGPSAFLEAAVSFPKVFAGVPSISLTLDQDSYLAGGEWLRPGARSAGQPGSHGDQCLGLHVSAHADGRGARFPDRGRL